MLPSSSTVFVSYASEDAAIARNVCDAIEAKGMRCWLALRDAGEGDFARNIEQALTAASSVVLLLTRHAVNSLHVTREVALAAANGITIVPMAFDETALTGALAYYLAGQQIIRVSTLTSDTEIDQIFRTINHVRPAEVADRFAAAARRYLDKVITRLRQPVTVKRAIRSGQANFSVVAHQSKYAGPLTLGFECDMFWIVQITRQVAYGDILSFIEDAGEYAYRHNTHKAGVLPSCIPITITANMNSALAYKIQNMQPLMWPSPLRAVFIGGALGLPCVYDVVGEALFYSRRSPILKVTMWPLFRSLVTQVLAV